MTVSWSLRLLAFSSPGARLSLRMAAIYPTPLAAQAREAECHDQADVSKLLDMTAMAMKRLARTEHLCSPLIALSAVPTRREARVGAAWRRCPRAFSPSARDILLSYPIGCFFTRQLRGDAADM